MLVDGLVIFFDGIPFVYSNNDTFSTVMGDSGNLGILLGNSFGGINHKMTTTSARSTAVTARIIL